MNLIGLGLGDEKDITVKGLETIRRCKAVFLEGYTSVLGVDKARLETFYGCPVTLMDREAVESECDEMLRMAKTDQVAFLVVGDVFGATTHTDVVVRAKRLGIQVMHLPARHLPVSASSACKCARVAACLCWWAAVWGGGGLVDRSWWRRVAPWRAVVGAALQVGCTLWPAVREEALEGSGGCEVSGGRAVVRVGVGRTGCW